MTSVTLPWPPASLSGHAKGHWRAKAAVTAKHRKWARDALLAARPVLLPVGDIAIHVCFVPPDRRSDRANFPVRMKPYFDGLADALCVNDRRFVPHFTYADPQKPGHVVVTIGGGE